MMGCTQGPKRSDHELWFIDPDDVTLYRAIGNDQEEVIPIGGNGVVEGFLCISEREFEKFIDDVLDKRGN